MKEHWRFARAALSLCIAEIPHYCATHDTSLNIFWCFRPDVAEWLPPSTSSWQATYQSRRRATV